MQRGKCPQQMPLCSTLKQISELCGGSYVRLIVTYWCLVQQNKADKIYKAAEKKVSFKK